MRTEASDISVSFQWGRRTGNHLCGKHGEGGRASFRYRGEHFLTTGSKELSKFTVIPDYQEAFARVLSIPSVISSCAELGIEGEHLIGMQGPFSTEINEAMLRQFRCSYLVTKDTGLAGGFPEKMEACQRAASPVIIGRPLQEEGLSLPESKGYFWQKLFGLTPCHRGFLL